MEKKVALTRVSFLVTIDGEDYKMTKPNLKLLKEFTAAQKENEKKEDTLEVINGSIKFLADLGLPESVSEGLDPEMLEDVTKIVTGQKKS